MRFLRSFAVLALGLFAASCAMHRPYGLVTTYSGELRGFVNGAAADARFCQPTALAAGQDGTLYIADTYNHRIRALAPDGSVTTLAGSGPVGHFGGGYRDGPGQLALFRYPRGLATDDLGHLYVADTNNNCIRVIDLVRPDHPVTTLAGMVVEAGFRDGPAGLARFSHPYSLALGGARPEQLDLYVCDTFNNRIRRIALGSAAHEVTTIAGTGRMGVLPGHMGSAPGCVEPIPLPRELHRKGFVAGGYKEGPGADARLYLPRGIAVDWRGEHPMIYVADSGNRAIRRIDMTDIARPIVSTVGGEVTAARCKVDPLLLVCPTGVTVDRSMPGGLFAIDGATGTVFRMAASGELTWLVGGAGRGAADGFWRGGTFKDPAGLVIDAAGQLLVADAGNNRIRLVR